MIDEPFQRVQRPSKIDLAELLGRAASARETGDMRAGPVAGPTCAWGKAGQRLTMGMAITLTEAHVGLNVRWQSGR